MITPLVAAGMKQVYDFSADWVDTRQIGALAEVTPVASQSEIVRLIGSAVLARNNVLNVMGYGAPGL